VGVFLQRFDSIIKIWRKSGGFHLFRLSAPAREQWPIQSKS